MTTPKRILLVDDDQFILGLLSERLVQSGYKIFTATNAAAALLLLAENPTDLVLLDVLIGDDDGFELFRKIRQKHERLPVIFLSGIRPEDDLFQMALETTGCVCLSKRTTMADLVKAIETALQSAV
jgi:two-component system OmpR family response regulator